MNPYLQPVAEAVSTRPLPAGYSGGCVNTTIAGRIAEAVSTRPLPAGFAEAVSTRPLPAGLA